MNSARETDLKLESEIDYPLVTYTTNCVAKKENNLKSSI